MTATKIFFSVLLCCWSFIGFSAETHYKNDTISFAIPDKWHITEERITGDEGIVIIKKKSFLSAAAVTISWHKSGLDIFDDLGQMAKMILQGSGINDPIPPAVKVRYGHYDADKIAVDTREALLARLRYEFYGFTVRKHSVFITQIGAQNHKANQAGFDTVEKTFRVLYEVSGKLPATVE